METLMKKRDPFHKLPPEKRLGDAPIQPEYVQQMTAVMEAVDEAFNSTIRPRKVGIVMMVFPYGDVSGRCNYMSNGADRKDIVLLMKEMVARFEGQPEIKGRA
jgi:hypothetical protein